MAVRLGKGSSVSSDRDEAIPGLDWSLLLKCALVRVACGQTHLRKVPSPWFRLRCCLCAYLNGNGMLPTHPLAFNNSVTSEGRERRTFDTGYLF